MKRVHRFTCLSLLLAAALLFSDSATAATPWEAGFAKVGITPVEPVRTSGYGNRDRPSDGVATPLFVRAFCLRRSEKAPGDSETAKTTASLPMVLLSIDNVGLSGQRTRRLAASIETDHGLPRSRIVFTNTHTHSAPDLGGQLSNIFAKPLTDEESAAAQRYADQLDQAVLDAVERSIENLNPARLSYGIGKASFAANRRVLSDGKWSGFGVQPDGPVDHAVPVLRVTDPDNNLLGVIFNYACHCTTLGGDYYRINADWAGHAAAGIEAMHPGATALCTIGCGADANPNPRGTADFAKMHGESLAAEVNRLIDSELAAIHATAEARFDYAALSFELPTREELQARLGETRPQTRRHAERMLKVLDEKGRLPATYPVPIQTWKFGDELTMVFIGGEVVVDYALRLKKSFDNPTLWVSAYCNDVLGYIASERMRSEGGYEFDRSGIYYGLPGPWASGTEDLLIRRIEDLVRGSGRPEPQSASTSLKSISVPRNLRVELVANEPLVQDPINIAFGDDGELWVVEMSDYPEGEDGGRIKTLRDTDGDGVFDEANVFLSGIAFPTGVQPWKDGVLISAAPEILFARDTNGDGRADEVAPVYSGFRLANPQHRVSGFTYGLDHSLHLASGDNLSELTSVKTGSVVNASGHDVQIWPDSGQIAATSGRSQYIRSRDSFGRWFGSSNSLPMFHFPIDDRYLRRNRSASYSAGSQQLFDPPVAPPVFPLTSSAERFNDLFAANRFTSACSSIIARSHHFQSDTGLTAFICEPVHNLVHRAILVSDGATFRAERLETESDREFLASTDPWFRPVRALVGPDGMLYVVDMYREVIEHPEWIPNAWQERLNLRAGENRGRIYRVVPQHSEPAAFRSLVDADVATLINQLRSPIGPLRDQAQRLLIHRGVKSSAGQLGEMAKNDLSPFARIHALSILAVAGQLSDDVLEAALEDSSPGVLCVAIRLCESRLNDSPQLLSALSPLAHHNDLTVALRTAIAFGQSESPHAGDALAILATRRDLDRWLALAITSSATNHAETITKAILKLASRFPAQLTDARANLLQQLLVTAKRAGVPTETMVSTTLDSKEMEIDTKLRIAECVVDAARKSSTDIRSLSNSLRPLNDQAKELLSDSSQSDALRCRAISLISLNLGGDESPEDLLLSLLVPTTPVTVQCEAITSLLRDGSADTLTPILERWPAFTTTVREHFVNQVLTRRSLTERLLGALESGEIKVNELTLAARSQLLKSGSRSMRVQAARLINRGGTAERESVVRQFLSQMTSAKRLTPSARKAVLDNGKALFEKHCGACHLPDETGIAIGASLDNLTNRTDEALVESILDPNKAVEPKYQNYLIQTVDGRTLSGVIESELAGSITIAHADGKRTTLPRGQIEAMKSSGTSLMPEGFETTLKPSELEAVIRYLQR